jgi:nicotinamidase-related amidase
MAAAACRRYYRHWREMTGGQFEPVFRRTRDRLEADTPVMTGGENDDRVLSAVMGAVDTAWRVVFLLTLLLRSVSDEAHDAARHYHTRFSWQIEVAASDENSSS